MRVIMIFIFLLFLPLCLVHSQQVIDVVEHGISDENRDSKQQDRDEAILDAKLKAIEKAGVNIEAVTTIVDFKLKKDWIESKAEAYMLPGFQIMETGYGEDNLYHVVLIGKVRASLSSDESSGITDEEERAFRYAKLVIEDPLQREKGRKLMTDYLSKYGGNDYADDALACLIQYALDKYDAKEFLFQWRSLEK